MLLSIFNLLIRWLFFIAIIWPVRAEASTDVFKPLNSVKKVYWSRPDFKVLLPEDIKEGICNASFVSQYFKVEKDFMNFSLFYVGHHFDILEAFYSQLKLDLQTENRDKKKWSANQLGIQNLAQYSESLYEGSDNLNIFFNQLEACWKLRPAYFVNLKKVVNNYRLQDTLLAEVIFSFVENLKQISSLLEVENLSSINKKQILVQLKFILKTSKEMQMMLFSNYIILANEIDYIAQVYWGI